MELSSTTKKNIFKATGLYIVMILFCGLTAPWVARALEIFDFKFRRIVSREVMIATFIFLGIIVKKSNIQFKDFFYSIGLRFEKIDRKYFFQGVVVCMVFMGGVFTTQALLGVRGFALRETGLALVWTALSIIVSAVVIALIEEVFFRGVVFRKLAKASLPFGFIISALFYAALHFLGKGDIPCAEPPAWFDGFRVLGAMGNKLLDPIAVAPAFFGLFLFGCILNLAYMRSGSLLLSMGIHAGAVFLLKFGRYITVFSKDQSQLIFGSKLLYDGVIGWVFLIVLWVFILLVYKKKRAA